jgi:hypothetical protein
VWTAITVEPKDEAFLDLNLEPIRNLVSDAIKAEHPEAAQLSKVHTQAWQKRITKALGTNATLFNAPPSISIMIQEPSKNWTDFDKAHKNKTVASRLHSVNTSHAGRTGRHESSQHSSSTWVFPPSGSVSQVGRIGALAGPSRRVRPLGQLAAHTSSPIRPWLEEADDDGYLRDEED